MAQQMSGRQRCFNMGAWMVTVALVTVLRILIPSQIERRWNKNETKGRISNLSSVVYVSKLRQSQLLNFVFLGMNIFCRSLPTLPESKR